MAEAMRPAGWTRTTMDEGERSILSDLDCAIRDARSVEMLEPLVARLEQRMGEDLGATMAWETIPLAAFGTTMPPDVRSSWCFILRAGPIEAERHPNSRQRTLSYRGSGGMRLRMATEWRYHALTFDPAATLEKRWLSIPPNVWHQPVVEEGLWVVVSFHTAAAQDLIVEHQDERDPSQLRRHGYVGGAGDAPGRLDGGLT